MFCMKSAAGNRVAGETWTVSSALHRHNTQNKVCLTGLQVGSVIQIRCNPGGGQACCISTLSVVAMIYFSPETLPVYQLIAACFDGLYMHTWGWPEQTRRTDADYRETKWQIVCCECINKQHYRRVTKNKEDPERIFIIKKTILRFTFCLRRARRSRTSCNCKMKSRYIGAKRPCGEHQRVGKVIKYRTNFSVFCWNRWNQELMKSRTLSEQIKETILLLSGSRSVPTLKHVTGWWSLSQSQDEIPHKFLEN